jgi:hypothetical protein
MQGRKRSEGNADADRGQDTRKRGEDEEAGGQIAEVSLVYHEAPGDAGCSANGSVAQLLLRELDSSTKSGIGWFAEPPQPVPCSKQLGARNAKVSF